MVIVFLNIQSILTATNRKLKQDVGLYEKYKAAKEDMDHFRYALNLIREIFDKIRSADNCLEEVDRQEQQLNEIYRQKGSELLQLEVALNQ